MIVKICGITNRDDAEAAVEAGAAALGFNFYPGSSRCITPELAAQIADGLDVWRTGVFVDEDPRRVKEIARAARLDIVQLHGSEPPACDFGGVRVWKAFRVANGWTPEMTVPYEVEAVLLDGSAPGSGTPFDWSRARDIRQPIVLAGGLDEANVAAAIAIVRPWGVDACSRLEKAPGVKDHAKMRRFIAAAKACTP
jgi:phosphoribosylanthranilate isomerase